MQPLTHGEPASPFLISLGWTLRASAEFAPHLAGGLVPGRVARVDRGSSIVLTERGAVRAKPSNEILFTASSEELPAVGDWVGVLARPRHDTDSIDVVLPRSSMLARTRGGSDSRSAVSEAQVIAANIDFVFATHAAIKTNIARLAREVAQIEQSGATPVALLTKSDLSADPSEVLERIELTSPGLRVHLTSGVTGHGVEELRQYLEGNRTVAFIGASGVGKSTVSNRLLGGELLETSDVRGYDGKGRHTTTARHLVPIPGGGVLIDTPGMRTFTLQGAVEGLERAFSDIGDLSQECRFRDCRHEDEPGCAVRSAISGGELNEERFDSFLKLGRELRHEQIKTDKAAWADERKRRRTWARHYRKNIKRKER